MTAMVVQPAGQNLAQGAFLLQALVLLLIKLCGGGIINADRVSNDYAVVSVCEVMSLWKL